MATRFDKKRGKQTATGHRQALRVQNELPKGHLGQWGPHDSTNFVTWSKQNPVFYRGTRQTLF